MASIQTPTGQSRVAAYYIISGIRQGVSGAGILRTLQQVGLGYRTQNFYTDYNYYLNNVSNLPRLSPTDYQWNIPENFYLNVPGRGAAFNKYIFNVNAVNTRTGRSSIRTLSVSSSRKLSPLEAFQQLAGALEEKYNYLQVQESGSEYTGALAYS